MPLPAIAAGGIAAAAKLGPPALAALKGFGSKHLLTLLITGGFLGQTGLTELGKAGERGLSREQIALQKLLGEGQAKVTKRSVKEDRARAKEYTEALLKYKKIERRELRETRLMESFSQSQDRQMAMILGAIQGLTSSKRPSSSSGGMLSMMRR